MLQIMNTEAIVNKIKNQGMKIATAESCTGGLLASTLTEISGVSDIFEGGISAYSNRVKQERLHVSKEFLDTYGAVSEQVAKAMSTSVCDYVHADIGISITGVAGPSCSENKPVGLVYYSIYIKPHNILLCEKLQLKGTRAQIRKKTVEKVLTHLDQLL